MFFRFFFTHLAQGVSDIGVTHWINIVRPSNSSHVPQSRSSDVVPLEFSSSDLRGLLNISCLEGQSYLDTSVTPSIPEGIDTSWDITADTTAQPVKEFLARIRTPISTSSYSYKSQLPYIGTELERQYPLLYSVNLAQNIPAAWYDQPVYQDSCYLARPVVQASPSSRYIFVTDEELAILRSRSVDVTLDEPVLPTNELADADGELFGLRGLSNGFLLKSDPLASWTFTGVRGLNDPTDLVISGWWIYINGAIDPFDLIDCDVIGRTVVNCEALPYGPLLFAWSDNRSEISYTWRGDEKRGYIPASVLSATPQDMQYANLQDIAVGLLSLIQLEEDELIFLALKELVYLWGYWFENLKVSDSDGSLSLRDLPHRGLPTTIPRAVGIYEYDRSEFSKERDALSYGWLGFAVVQAIKYLRNRPTSERITVPYETPLLLVQLGHQAADFVHPITGWASQSEIEGNYSGIYSYPATVMIAIFLEELLSVQYDQYIHLQAARCKNRLSSLREIPAVPYAQLITEEERVLSAAYQLLWFYRSQPEVDLQELQEFIVSIISNPDKDVSPWALYILNYCNARAVDGKFPGFTSNNIYNLVFSTIDSGLSRCTVDASALPLLRVSAWRIIISSHKSLFLDPPSKLYNNSAELEAGIRYNVSRRLWPIGDRWTKESAELVGGGEVGAILWANSQVSFLEALIQATLDQSVSLESAWGWILSDLGLRHNFPRPSLQSDHYYRQALRLFSSLKLGQESALQAWASDIGGVLVNVEDTPTVEFRMQNSRYVKRRFSELEPLELLQLQNLVTLKTAQVLEGGSVNLESMWAKVGGVANLTCYGYTPDYEPFLRRFRPAGIRLNSRIELVAVAQHYQRVCWRKV